MRNRDFQKQYEQIRQEVLKDSEVKEFLVRHQQQLDKQIVNRSLNKLHEYASQIKNCHHCQGINQCQNMIKGYQPHLVLKNNYIDVNYEKCLEMRLLEERQKQSSLIKSLYMPKEILEADFNKLETDYTRINAINLAADFIDSYEPGKKVKGLYLYGSFGVGKTYLLGAIANQLARKGIQSMLVYTPEFMREMKSSLHDQSINEKVQRVKQVQVLMFDDLGAESMSSWMRDDILGTILQYRMMENLPTFFTSNMNYTELQHHLSTTQRGEVEELKAGRIMERIKYLTIPVEMSGKNRRQ